MTGVVDVDEMSARYETDVRIKDRRLHKVSR